MLPGARVEAVKGRRRRLRTLDPGLAASIRAAARLINRKGNAI